MKLYIKQKQFQQILMKKSACKTQHFYILLAYSLMTIALLIAVSNSCYLIKYQAKQKYLLQFQVSNNELKQVIY